MKSKVLKIIISALVCLFAVASFTGCSEPPKALAVVIGPYSTSKQLDLDDYRVVDNFREAAESFGFISVTVDDGRPVTVNPTSFKVPDEYSNASTAKLQADARDKAEELLSSMKNLKAEDPEVNTLEALRCAASSFYKDGREFEDKTILVIETGLQTTGLLNMRTTFFRQIQKR